MDKPPIFPTNKSQLLPAQSVSDGWTDRPLTETCLDNEDAPISAARKTRRNPPGSTRCGFRSEIVDDSRIAAVPGSRSSCEIEAVEVHHLGPRRHEVFHELLLRVSAGI